MTRYGYSPESFTLTEPEYTIDLCEAVMDVIEPTPDDPIILNRSMCSTTPSTRLAKVRTPPPWHTSRPCSPPSNASSTDRTSRVRLVAFLSRADSAGKVAGASPWGGSHISGRCRAASLERRPVLGRTQTHKGPGKSRPFVYVS